MEDIDTLGRWYAAAVSGRAGQDVENYNKLSYGLPEDQRLRRAKLIQIYMTMWAPDITKVDAVKTWTYFNNKAQWGLFIFLAMQYFEIRHEAVFVDHGHDPQFSFEFVTNQLASKFEQFPKDRTLFLSLIVDSDFPKTHIHRASEIRAYKNLHPFPTATELTALRTAAVWYVFKSSAIFQGDALKLTKNTFNNDKEWDKYVQPVRAQLEDKSAERIVNRINTMFKSQKLNETRVFLQFQQRVMSRYGVAYTATVKTAFTCLTASGAANDPPPEFDAITEMFMKHFPAHHLGLDDTGELYNYLLDAMVMTLHDQLDKVRADPQAQRVYEEAMNNVSRARSEASLLGLAWNAASSAASAAGSILRGNPQAAPPPEPEVKQEFAATTDVWVRREIAGLNERIKGYVVTVQQLEARVNKANATTKKVQKDFDAYKASVQLKLQEAEAAQGEYKIIRELETMDRRAFIKEYMEKRQKLDDASSAYYARQNALTKDYVRERGDRELRQLREVYKQAVNDMKKFSSGFAQLLLEHYITVPAQDKMVKQAKLHLMEMIYNLYPHVKELKYETSKYRTTVKTYELDTQGNPINVKEHTDYTHTPYGELQETSIVDAKVFANVKESVHPTLAPDHEDYVDWVEHYDEAYLAQLLSELQDALAKQAEAPLVPDDMVEMNKELMNLHTLSSEAIKSRMAEMDRHAKAIGKQLTGPAAFIRIALARESQYRLRQFNDINNEGIDSLKKRIVDLETQVATLTTQNTELTTRVAHQEGVAKKFALRNAMKARTVNQQTALITVLQGQVVALRSKLPKHKETLLKKAEEIEQLQKQVQQLESAVVNKHDVVVALRERVRELKEQKQKLQEQLANATARSDIDRIGQLIQDKDVEVQGATEILRRASDVATTEEDVRRIHEEYKVAVNTKLQQLLQQQQILQSIVDDEDNLRELGISISNASTQLLRVEEQIRLAQNHGSSSSSAPAQLSQTEANRLEVAKAEWQLDLDHHRAEQKRLMEKLQKAEEEARKLPENLRREVVHVHSEIERQNNQMNRMVNELFEVLNEEPTDVLFNNMQRLKGILQTLVAQNRNSSAEDIEPLQAQIREQQAEIARLRLVPHHDVPPRTHARLAHHISVEEYLKRREKAQENNFWVPAVHTFSVSVNA